MPEHDRNERPVYSDWIPREAGGGLDWSKVQVVPSAAVTPETGLDADGRPWISVRVLPETGWDHLFFRLL